MPELPEVETTRRGIAPHINGQRIAEVVVRDRRLRWPVPRGFGARLRGQRVSDVQRRAKYLVIALDDGTILLHLGMSGSLRVLTEAKAPGPHDHIDIVFENGIRLRYNDPRRFGSVHWVTGDPLAHRLLRDLGPEPLSDLFDADYLYRLSRGRRGAVKNFLMDQSVVVGVGNIYACEALFVSGIHPSRAAGRVSQLRYTALVDAVCETLRNAIEAGGTTLRDFVGTDGSPGYFSQALKVYGREGEPCTGCATPLRRTVIGQRSTFFCAACQR